MQKLALNDEQILGTKYVIEQDENQIELPEDDTPLIIAEKPTNIEVLTVSDAVMRMDLSDLPAIMFINKATNAINVVYRTVSYTHLRAHETQ